MTYNYNNNNNMYQPYNRASTPNPGPRQNFQAPLNITKKKSPFVIEISKNNGPKVIIETNSDKRSTDHSVPQVERPNTPNAIISFKSHDRLQTPSQPPPPTVTTMSSGNISMQGSSSFGSTKINIVPASNKNPNPPQIQISTQLQQNPPLSNPQNEAFNRLSLLSFVSTFEDEKSFNETDLEVLGLDLKCQEPLLPMLHSVLSDAPLLDHSKHPMPECYSKIQSGNPSDKLSLFSPQTLLFIFYTYPRDPLQFQAATELQRRQWQFDEENDEWKDQDGNAWSVDQWREESEESQGNEIGDSMFLHRTE